MNPLELVSLDAPTEVRTFEKGRFEVAIRNTEGASRRAAPRRNTSAPPSRAPKIDMTKP